MERSPKAYIETFGCTFNQADSQIMKALLAQRGFQIVDEIEVADAIIVNSCYVKLPTEHRITHRLKDIQNEYPSKRLIVAGCMVEIHPEKLEKIAPGSCWIGPHLVDQVGEVATASLDGRTVKLGGKKRVVKASLPRIRDNPVIEIVQVSEGCLGVCSYCCTRFARGRLLSYPEDTIKERVREAVQEGVREIWLTAQDMGCYGKDIGSNLPSLLAQVCSVEGDFVVRVGMINPAHAKDFADDLQEVYCNRKIFAFLHLPVQSGSDRMLALMQRGYEARDFLDIVTGFRERYPSLTISTDVIAGFPTETDDDFMETLKLIEATSPDILNVSKFFPRPRTVAAQAARLTHQVVKERSRTLARFHREISLERNRQWVGWEGKVLVDEKGREDTWVGRNLAYKPVVFEAEENMLGRLLEVRVTDSTATYLKGTVLS